MQLLINVRVRIINITRPRPKQSFIYFSFIDLLTTVAGVVGAAFFHSVWSTNGEYWRKIHWIAKYVNHATSKNST